MKYEEIIKEGRYHVIADPVQFAEKEDLLRDTEDFKFPWSKLL